MQKLTAIPFQGFYESIPSNEIDQYIERELEYLAESVDNQQAIDAYGEYFNDAINWQKAHEAYSKKYVDRYVEAFEDETGINLKLEFESLESPRYYNYSTDRIFCHIKPSIVYKLYREVDKEKLQERIKERFTSCSGFISSYPNDLADWPKISQWDHNQIETLLEAFTDVQEVYNVDTGNGEIDEAIYSAIPSDKRTILNTLRECLENHQFERFEAVLQADKDARIPMKGTIATFKNEVTTC